MNWIRKIEHFVQLMTNMGSCYTAYRVKHEVEKRAGLLKIKHPANPAPKYFISLKEWRTLPARFLIGTKEEMKTTDRLANDELAEKTSRILNYETLFFSSEWKQLGAAYDWITNPVTGFRYDVNKHWSEIADLSRDAGDIKYVWEKSRFSWVLTIIRNDYHHDEDHSDFIFDQIEDWIDRNPVNQGPNWRCSQEISLRIFNWCYALHFYRDSGHLTEKLWNKIQNVIYWSLHHVYHHIDFSRIAVRNNHAVTETLFLALSKVLFPFIPETEQWSKKGRRWFEQEVDYQIYDDGTFLQFSMNYHRVMIQLFSFGLATAERNGISFSPTVYDKAYKSLDFLYQCLQEENGWLPNYGSNDGAWFFPLSDTDYRDYRPQLNTLHKILTGKDLYEQKYLTEDSLWITAALPVRNSYKPVLHKKYGTLSYPIGGFYVLREKESFTFIRCGNHKDRPAQADNLHIDVWVKGQNILRDSGTYQYNTSPELLDYFMGSASHNTVMVDSQSQMLKGSRFIWYYWSQCLSAEWKETENEYIFEGKISAFRFLNPKATHHRTIIKKKGESIWTVKDLISHLPDLPKKQLWHPATDNLKIMAEENHRNMIAQKEVSYDSCYYGQMSEEQALSFEFKSNITTTLTLE